jgi:hypothetical protein
MPSALEDCSQKPVAIPTELPDPHLINVQYLNSNDGGLSDVSYEPTTSVLRVTNGSAEIKRGWGGG